MYLSERWSGYNLRRIIAAVVGAVYVLSIGAILSFTLPNWCELPLVGVAVMCAILLIVWMIDVVVVSRSRKRAVIAILPTLLMLLSIVPLFFGSSRVVFVVGVCLAWILIVRSIAQGNALLFAFLAVLGVGALAGLAMGAAERKDLANGGINSFGDAMIWAGSRLFGFEELSALAPQTAQGKLMGFLILLCGLFFAAVMVSAITAWVMGDRYQQDEEDLEARVEAAVERGIRAAIVSALGDERAAEILRPRTPESDLATAAGTKADRYEGSQVWIDNDQVVGRTLDGWWNPRRISTAHFLEQLALTGDAILGLGAWQEGADLPSIMIVLEGGARQVADGPRATTGGLPFNLSRVPQTGAQYIVERASANDLVVSSDEALCAQLQATGIAVIGVDVFRHALVGAAPAVTA